MKHMEHKYTRCDKSVSQLEENDKCALTDALCTSIKLYCGMLERVENELEEYSSSVYICSPDVRGYELRLAGEYYKKMVVFECRNDTYGLDALLRKLKTTFQVQLDCLNSLKDYVAREMIALRTQGNECANLRGRMRSYSVYSSSDDEEENENEDDYY